MNSAHLVQIDTDSRYKLWLVFQRDRHRFLPKGFGAFGPFVSSVGLALPLPPATLPPMRRPVSLLLILTDRGGGRVREGVG